MPYVPSTVHAGFCDVGCLGTLTIGGYPLNTPAWDVPNPMRLIHDAAVRGENVVLPGAPGVRGNPRRLDAAEFELAMFITGAVDAAGVLATNPWLTLENNLAALWANVFAPVSTGRGTRAATLVSASGLTYTATVTMLPLTFPNDFEDPYYVEATIHLIVTSGRFVRV